MRSSKTALARGLGIAALCAATFAWGQHLAPDSRAGHDLYQATYGSRAAASLSPRLYSPQRLLVLASSQPGGARVAQAAAPDTSLADDAASDSPAATFQQVYYLLRRNYVEGVSDDSKLAHGAAAAMVASLQDPASRFLEPSEMAELGHEAQGHFSGLGAVTAIRTTVQPKTADDPTRDAAHPDNISYALTIVSALPGSPAERAGLKTGDVVTDINGQWVASYDLVSAQAKALKAAQDKNDPVALGKIVDAIQKKLDNGLTLAQAQVKLTTPAPKPLLLAVTRPGSPKPLSLTVDTTQPTLVSAVSAKTLASGVGYIKVQQFTDSTPSAFNAALTTLGTDIKGLVLDLRGATGGDLDAAASITGHLSTTRTLGIELTKGLKETPIAVPPAAAITCPVVVLTDGGTANAAELVASALQVRGAKLVGATTFGDDTEVKAIPLRDGSGFTMTIGQLRTGADAVFGGVGIKPDVPVADAPGTDAPLSRALMELSGRVARLPLASS